MAENPKRRVDDTSDFKLHAPRWFLITVIGVLLFILTPAAALVWWNVTEHVLFTKGTALSLEAVKHDAESTARRTTALERAMSSVCEDLRDSRTDQLSWQLVQAKRQGLSDLAEDIDRRLLLARQKAANNGCRDHTKAAMP